jgi:hypothetical protein
MRALAISAELAASIEKMRGRSWNDDAARAYEHGAAPTRQAVQARGQVRASRATPRPCRRRLSDEERIQRRNRKRMLGGSSALPDTLRRHYTEGERAVLCIVAGEVKRHGQCDLCIDEIADRAGVGRTTVQNAMHEARRLGHVKITERPQLGIARNLTNVVEVTSREWLAWIKRGPSAAQRDRVQFSKNVSTSKSWEKKEATTERAERQQGAIRGEPWGEVGSGLGAGRPCDPYGS